MIEASIIILTKNEERNIGTCLARIYDQDYEGAFEVIVIDSGSEDNTVQIAARYPIKLFQMSADEFNHGGSRNLGARMSEGRYLVYITADAFPADRHWLSNLLAGFESDDTAGVYGRQLPKEGASPLERFQVGYLYGLQKRVQRARSKKEINMWVTLFSNVNAAMRRDVWERYPFSEALVYNEDQEWSKRILIDGYQIIYVPEAVVYHSHNRNLRKTFQRFFDSGMTSAQCYLPEVSSASLGFIRIGLGYLWKELKFLFKQGYIIWVPYAIVYELVKFSGIYLGRQNQWLPFSLKKRLSLNKAYWHQLRSSKTR